MKSEVNESVKSGAVGRQNFWTLMRVLLTLVTVGLLVALGLSSCNSSGPEKNPTASPNAPAAPPAKNAPAAGFITLSPDLRDLKLQTVDGESLRLSDYRDNVLVVNIWATWCGPCRTEMPDLVKLGHEYKSRGVVVLGLATTYNEQNDPARVKNFVRAQSIDYKIVWDDGSLTGPLVQSVNGHGVIPQSFVITRDGRITKHFEGFSPLSTPTLMRQAVEEALNDKGKA